MNDKIFLILGGGVLIYLWYQSQNSTAAAIPSDAIFALYVPSGASQSLTLNGSSTPTTVNGVAYIYYSPSTNQLYASSVAPTTAQQSAGTAAGLPGYGTSGAPAAGSTAGSTPSGITASSVGGNTTTASGVTTNANYQANPVTSLASIYTAMVAEGSKDAAYIANNGLMSPQQWNFYLGYVDPTAPVGMVWPPDPTAAGFTDAVTPISAQAYWTVMSPYLQAKYGMSGLRGLGAIRSAYFDNRHGGWAA